MGKVYGHLVALSEGRKVFVGADPECAGVKVICFVNSYGDHMNIALSDEAALALHGILLKPGGDVACPEKEQDAKRWVEAVRHATKDMGVDQ